MSYGLNSWKKGLYRYVGIIWGITIGDIKGILGFLTRAHMVPRLPSRSYQCLL